jgi:hypothetical protein
LVLFNKHSLWVTSIKCFKVDYFIFKMEILFKVPVFLRKHHINHQILKISSKKQSFDYDCLSVVDLKLFYFLWILLQYYQFVLAATLHSLKGNISLFSASFDGNRTVRIYRGSSFNFFTFQPIRKFLLVGGAMYLWFPFLIEVQKILLTLSFLCQLHCNNAFWFCYRSFISGKINIQ